MIVSPVDRGQHAFVSRMSIAAGFSELGNFAHDRWITSIHGDEFWAIAVSIIVGVKQHQRAEQSLHLVSQGSDNASAPLGASLTAAGGIGAFEATGRRPSAIR